MSLWNNQKPPVLYPDAVATPAGWADPVTGELLVAVTGLSTYKNQSAGTQLVSARILGAKAGGVDPIVKKKVFAAGDVIVVEATFLEPVTKTGGTPTMAITVNGNSRTFTQFTDSSDLKSDGVTVANGSGTNRWLFGYTVASAETATSAQIVFPASVTGVFDTTGDGVGASGAGTAVISTGVNAVTVTAPGTGYTSAPDVTFTGGTPTSPATAVAVLDRGVSAVNVTAGGSGYTSAPTVAITSGGGSGATATAVLAASGSVKSVTVGGSGTGYTNGDTVSITGGGGTGATGTLVTSSGNVTSVTITAGGSGYTSAPTVAVTSGVGSGNTFTAVLGKAVASVTVSAAGSGFTSVPTVGFSSGGGTGAAATAVLSNLTTVASVTVTFPGAGYGSAPAVGFQNGGGSGATATATTAGVVESVTITNPGTAYWNTPTIGFSGGAGTGAAGTVKTDRGTITGVTITNYGTGYTSAPTVAFTEPSSSVTNPTFNKAPSSQDFTVDGVAPTITGATISGFDHGTTFITNDFVVLTLTTSKPVLVTGSPYITVTINGSAKQALYVQGSGTTTLVFQYEIASGDFCTATQFTITSPAVLNSGTIKDIPGNALTLTFSAPTVTAVVVNSPLVAKFSSAALSGFNSGTAFITANTLTVTLTANVNATVVTTNGTPYIELFVGNNIRFATYASGSGSTSLVFHYTVTSLDVATIGTFSTASSVIMNGGTIRDGSANDFSGTFTAPSTSTVTVN